MGRRVSVTADAIEFKRGSAILAVPRNAVDSCKFIDDMLERITESLGCLREVHTSLRYSSSCALSALALAVVISMKVGLTLR